MNGPLVFIAGPYSADPTGGTRVAVDVHVQLLDAGIPSICPHLSHITDLIHPRPYERWVELALAQVERCDWLLRLDGDSPGADRERRHAESLGIPVWEMTGCAGTSVERFIAHIQRSPIEAAAIPAARLVIRGGMCGCRHHLNQHNGVQLDSNSVAVKSGFCVMCDCQGFRGR